MEQAVSGGVDRMSSELVAEQVASGRVDGIRSRANRTSGGVSGTSCGGVSGWNK